MLKIIITAQSEVAKWKALGVREREEPRWQSDRMNLPFTRQEYGHTYKTVTRGSKKRV